MHVAAKAIKEVFELKDIVRNVIVDLFPESGKVQFYSNFRNLCSAAFYVNNGSRGCALGPTTKVEGIT